MSKFIAYALIAAAGTAAAPGFAGQDFGGEVGYVPQVSNSKSSVTRAAVRADYLQAQRTDALPELGEGADIAAVAAAGSTRSRNAVRAEAVYAVQHGQRLGGEV